MKPNSGTLVINIMNGGKAEAYEGIYQCTARNERGAAISNNIVVRPSSKLHLIFVKCETLWFAYFLVNVLGFFFPVLKI